MNHSTSAAAAEAADYIESLQQRAARLDRQVRVMEVCGTHTHELRRRGIHTVLPTNLKLVSGPGCPVCVSPRSYIDNALRLIREHDCTIVTFGDMARVPSSSGEHLAGSRPGNRLRIVYSPMELVRIAESVAGPVVFLGIGFETTIPTVLLGLQAAIDHGLGNCYIYSAFKTVPPILRVLLEDPDQRIDGFLLPGHVSVVIGSRAYGFLTGPKGIPGVVTGFEAHDMLRGLDTLLGYIAAGERKVGNTYRRVVKETGNLKAKALMATMLEPYNAVWRGLGRIPASGLRLKPEFAEFDAARRFNLDESATGDTRGCICGLVVQGKAEPSDCPLFGTGCVPEDPVGPCMVATEGTCAAYFKYGDEQISRDKDRSPTKTFPVRPDAEDA